MAERRPFDFQGRKVLGEAVSFTSTGPEAWNTYQLADGTSLKMKLILLNVARLEEFSPDGTPVYQFQAQQIVTIEAPEKLKKQVEQKKVQ